MNLEKISLIISFLGIIILAVISQSLEPKEMKISEISSKVLEGYVKVKGNLTSIKEFENMEIFKIQDETESISAVLYEKINLSSGINVEIIGKVVRYKGELEIEVQKIKVVE